MIDSESDLLSALLKPVVHKTMDPQQLQRIVESAVASALAVQATKFNAKIKDLSDRLERAATITAP